MSVYGGKNMNEMMLKLRAPFPASKLSWRVGQTNKDKTKAMMLVYIDARDVQDRLDEVFGLGWSSSFREVDGRIVCAISAMGYTKEDGAEDTQFEAKKGGLSDAFKRAAVQWGVGRYLYDAKNYNTWIDIKDMQPWEYVENNRQQLDNVAQMLGRDYILYPLFLDKIDNCVSVDEFEYVRSEARKYAKREAWNMSQLETFKKHCSCKEKELKG